MSPITGHGHASLLQDAAFRWKGLLQLPEARPQCHEEIFRVLMPDRVLESSWFGSKRLASK